VTTKDAETLLMALRMSLVSTLEMINQYQEYIYLTDVQEARRALAYLRDDEKKHAAQLMMLIQKLDPVQAHAFAEQDLIDIDWQRLEEMIAQRESVMAEKPELHPGH
jgi:hypothetical protein